MKHNILDWWGYRIRSPYSYDPKPVTFWEKFSYFLIWATAFNFFWLMVLLSPLEVETITAMIIPASSLALALIFARFLPEIFLERLNITIPIILSREQGAIRGWDKIILSLTVIIFLCSIIKLQGPALFTAVTILCCIFLSIVGFIMFQERVDFTKRQWTAEVPEWLKRFSEKDNKEEDKKTEEEKEVNYDEIIPPDEGATPTYDLNVKDRKHHLGIKIPAHVLEQLRNINVENKTRDNYCALYQVKPEAVILMDDAPVNGTGKNEIIRLSRQFLSIAKHHYLTRLQLANLVLRFVQEKIPYQFDIDSTSHIPGGPYEEYGRFALETIVDKCGDCECTSILCATLLAYLDFKTALIVVKLGTHESDEFHAAVGLVADNIFMPSDSLIDEIEYITDGTKDVSPKYLYGETATSSEISFGTIPGQWKSEGFTVHKIIPIDRPA